MSFEEENVMLVIVKCSKCGNDEYWGMLHYVRHSRGVTMCRQCTYDIWESVSDWRRTENDYVFPFYNDGVDYRDEIAKIYI